MSHPIKSIYFSAILLGGLLLNSVLCPSTHNTGVKYFKNYTSGDYNHHPQNWSVAQTKRGFIYVANQAGVLEFDGVSWRIIRIPNISARSITIDENDFVYIGGKNEIGFLSPDPSGKMKYTSLVGHLNENQRNFSDVWSAHSTKEGIYFRTSKYLFRWNSIEMKAWETNLTFKASFYCRGKFYVQQENVGLLQMIDDSLQLVPGGDVYKSEKICMMVPYDSHKFLLGMWTNRFSIYDGVKSSPWLTGADDYLKKNQLYNGIRLSPGNFTIATLQGGLVIIDANGDVIRIFDKICGLQDNNVKNVFEDREGNLWLPLNNGITKIENSSPITIYDNRVNVPGMVLSITKLQEVLYIGTNLGLYYLESSSLFKPVPGRSDMVFSLLSNGSSLLAATNKGVFSVEKNKFSPQPISTKCAYVLVRSNIKPNRIWAGTESGLISLAYKNSRWIEENQFGNITPPIYTIVEDPKGNLWLGALTQGVIKVDFQGDTLDPVTTRYNTVYGLPPGEVHVFTAANHVIFATGKGIYRFDENKKVFILDYTLGEEFANGSRNVFRIAEDIDKNIWFHSKAKNFHAFLKKDKTYSVDEEPFLRIPIAQVNAIFPEKDAVWFGSVDGLIRFDKTVKKDNRVEYDSYIRSVSINGKPLVLKDDKVPTLPFKNLNMRIKFAAPFFEDEKNTRYRYILEGYDEGWSSWKRETKKDYTNLDPGFYTFRAQAKNIYNKMSREGLFRFKIRTPWHRTWWAYLIYLIAIIFLMYFTAKGRSWKLEVKKRRLEQIIKDRTGEIEEKNLQLELQAFQLKEQSEQLKEMDKVKSRFFANISHEFRTPLTLIMGPLEQIRTDYNDTELQKKADVMLRNSRRLLALINQLLDLSKLDSSKMELRVFMQNVVPFLKGALSSFDSLLVHNKQELTFQADEEDITVYFDPEKLEKIIINLVSNAIKFTHEGGNITVKVKRCDSTSGTFPSGYLEISIGDTGIGIPVEQLPYVFDRFYQVESPFSFEHKNIGSGIGLALSKELVELHHGEIEVKSAEYKGTEFIIRIPMGKEHLKAGEIIEDSEIRSNGPVELFEIPPVNANATEDTVEITRNEKNIILVVEDNIDVRNFIRESLESLYTIMEASDGKKGIEKAKEIIPDLIISDIMMPGEDGYELCRTLKKEITTSHIPIILLTAKAAEENIIQGLETGADDYITKPFNTRILMARIKNVIELRRQLQQKRLRQVTLQPTEMRCSSVDEAFYKELQEIIEKNLSDPEFNVEQMCRKLYMGRTTLYRKVLALTGEPPTDFIRSYRLMRAAQLLKARFGNITEVAFEAGFSSAAYFARCFKEKFHQTPSEFMDSTGK